MVILKTEIIVQILLLIKYHPTFCMKLILIPISKWRKKHIFQTPDRSIADWGGLQQVPSWGRPWGSIQPFHAISGHQSAKQTTNIRHFQLDFPLLFRFLTGFPNVSTRVFRFRRSGPGHALQQEFWETGTWDHGWRLWIAEGKHG